MDFHEIDSVAGISSEHKVIIYYIECKETDFNASKLQKALETVLKTLEKKNDDLLIVKVLSGSEEFTKFQQLYNADIKGQVTLFVVNNEGIPIISQHIYEQSNILGTILSICSVCALNPVPALDLDAKSESVPCTDIHDVNTTAEESSSTKSTRSLSQSEVKGVDPGLIELKASVSAMASELQHDNCAIDSHPSSTQLQLRLPDGSRHKQQFDKESTLNEVWVFISTQFKLKDFDLKTYNHQNFTEAEYENTLNDLDLYPNGVVIVVPKLGVLSNNNNGWIGSMFRLGLYQLLSKTTSTFSYIQGLFIILRNWLFSSNNRPIDGNNRRRNQGQPSQKSSRPSDQSSSQRRSKSSTSSFGNVHTLRRNDDSDDENNRYNGNSTQQK